MTFAPVDTDPTCVSVSLTVDTPVELLLILGVLAIPAVAIPLIARIARMNPTREEQRLGHRPAGVRLLRWGIAVTTVGILGFTGGVILGATTPELCDQTSGVVAVSAIALVLVGALMIGGGWAAAIRSSWVVLATVATLDVWIFYVNLLTGLFQDTSVQGVLLLAFAIHAICSTIAGRWSFTARDLGPIERAKAGEAGRSLAAVWVFLVSYAAVSVLRQESGILNTPAGSAVIGALTVGALAVTMGSGFTKYAEAIHAARPAADQAQTPDPRTDPAESADLAAPIDAARPGTSPAARPSARMRSAERPAAGGPRMARMSDHRPIFLMGGGWQLDARDLMYGPFLAAAGDNPTVACIVLDEGDGAQQFDRWATALTQTAPCTPDPVLIPIGGLLDVGALAGCDGLLVCGGLTPAYAAALSPVAPEIIDMLGSHVPYAGFSAGAAVAARRALVGGWRRRGVPVCPEDSGEDLDEITVTAGLGLVSVAVDVHAAQWGTLARLIAAVAGGLVTSGVAIDENTMLAVGPDGSVDVRGRGRVHRVRSGDSGVRVESFAAGAAPPDILTG